MENPWRGVDGADGDWRHPDDSKVVPAPVTMPPQPWLGSFDRGRVCWLLGGFGTGDGMAFDDPALCSIVTTWARRNLIGNEPNLWLDPRPEYTPLAPTRDVQWWLRATRALRTELGADSQARALLADRLFVLESYPYPMKTNPHRLLPTHDYTAQLLNDWITSRRPIVVGRGLRTWTELVPALTPALHSGLAHTVRNVQAATISASNLTGGATVFSDLVENLRR